MPKQAQGSELDFAFRNTLRIIVVELPDELIKGAVALGFGQLEQDVADLLGGVPVGEAEFGHDVLGVGGKFQVAFLDKIGYLKAYSTFRAAFYRIFARLHCVATGALATQKLRFAPF